MNKLATFVKLVALISILGLNCAESTNNQQQQRPMAPQWQQRNQQVPYNNNNNNNNNNMQRLQRTQQQQLQYSYLRQQSVTTGTTGLAICQNVTNGTAYSIAPPASRYAMLNNNYNGGRVRQLTIPTATPNVNQTMPVVGNETAALNMILQAVCSTVTPANPCGNNTILSDVLFCALGAKACKVNLPNNQLANIFSPFATMMMTVPPIKDVLKSELFCTAVHQSCCHAAGSPLSNNLASILTGGSGNSGSGGTGSGGAAGAVSSLMSNPQVSAAVNGISSQIGNMFSGRR